jgi:ribonucleoside-diphosphate reductase alpha chain
VLGTASGIHAWHAPYYLRTMRFNKNEDIAMYLEINHPELCEDDVLRPKDTLCVRIPVKAPEGSIFRTESPLDTLERVKKFSQEWIKPGHINGDNTHNVSATISIADEWEVVGQWMWDNREVYNGLSVLPYFGGTYKQAPFEDITEEEYNNRIAHLTSVDLTKVIEQDDSVDFGQVAACAGGACEIQ